MSDILIIYRTKAALDNHVSSHKDLSALGTHFDFSNMQIKKITKHGPNIPLGTLNRKLSKAYVKLTHDNRLKKSKDIFFPVQISKKYLKLSDSIFTESVSDIDEETDNVIYSRLKTIENGSTFGDLVNTLESETNLLRLPKYYSKKK